MACRTRGTAACSTYASGTPACCPVIARMIGISLLCGFRCHDCGLAIIPIALSERERFGERCRCGMGGRYCRNCDANSLKRQLCFSFPRNQLGLFSHRTVLLPVYCCRGLPVRQSVARRDHDYPRQALSTPRRMKKKPATIRSERNLLMAR